MSVTQKQHTVDVKHNFFGAVRREDHQRLESDLNAILEQYNGIRFVDMKFIVDHGEIRKIMLNIQYNPETPNRGSVFRIKHFIGKGRKVRFWLGKPPSDDFDTMINDFTENTKGIRVRQTRNITREHVVTDVFLLYSHEG